MRDVSYVVAIFGALFLVIAAVALWRIARKPDERPPTAKDNRRSSSAALVVVVAFLLSAIAAIVAILGWFQK
ncbi:MAG TPA: hypothetical protein VNH53_07660 [Sphingomicrobium sp.]|jgi:CDP-diglyceride synthetase|nr:hypothetical protein [Sphingomicrobium sp.]